MMLNSERKGEINVNGIELFEYDAVPTWAGFIYQGYIALYVSLKMILNTEENGKSIENYELILEKLEDVSIVYNDNGLKEYVSIHQVKSRKDTKVNNYTKALKQLMYEKALVKSESNNVKAYLHVRKELTDVVDGNISVEMNNAKEKIRKSYEIIEKYHDIISNNKITKTSKKRLLSLIKKDYFNINRSEYTTARKNIISILEKEDESNIETEFNKYKEEIEKCINKEFLDSDIELYRYENNKYNIEYGQLENEIQDLVKRYEIKQNKTYSEDEIRYIYYDLTERIVDNIAQRHKEFEEKNKSIEISFKDIISILNSSVDDYNKRLNILQLKNLFRRHIYDYCDKRCKNKTCENKPEVVCKLKKIENEILNLSEDKFKSFCYNLNPDCIYDINERLCLHELLQTYGVLLCFFKGVQMIKYPKKLKDNRCVYSIGNNNNNHLSGIYVPDEIELKSVVSRIEKNLKDNRKKEDLVNLFESDKIIIKGAEADSTIWSSDFIKKAYDEDDEEAKKDKEEDHYYVTNYKCPEFIDVENVINKGEQEN